MNKTTQVKEKRRTFIANLSKQEHEDFQRLVILRYKAMIPLTIAFRLIVQDELRRYDQARDMSRYDKARDIQVKNA